MAKPTEADSLQTWLDFVLSSPSTEQKPREHVSTTNLAWILENMVKSLHTNIREQLAKPLSIMYLTQLNSVTNEVKIEPFMEEYKHLSDSDMRKYLTSQISLNALANGCEVMKVNMAKVRLDMWKAILVQVNDPKFFTYPETMSSSLQKMVIRTHCKVEAEFLDTINGQQMTEIMKEELFENEKMYLNHHNRESVCKTVRNINMLRQKKMEDKLKECQGMLDDASQDVVVKEKLKGVNADLKKYNKIMTEWKRGEPDYSCVGDECKKKIHALSTLAVNFSVFADSCTNKVKEVRKARLNERQQAGEKLTTKEKFRRIF